MISIIIITFEIIILGNLRSKRRQNENIAKKAAKRINKKDSAEETKLNTSIKCIRLTKASRINKFFLQARKEELKVTVYSTYSVRTACLFARFSPDSDFTHLIITSLVTLPQ